MSKPSQSHSQPKSSTSSASVCPPTARSPSLLTADALTDPNQIPTALSNSVNTAIGATPSDFETSSGLSDTSAGSNRISSSEPRTAKSPTSPEMIMHDLKKGTLFGRQSQSQATEGPKSVTNITFTSNPTNISTASELESMKQLDEKKLDNSHKSGKSGKLGKSAKSAKTAKSGKSGKSGKSTPSKSMKTGKERIISRFGAKKFQPSDNAFSTGSTASSVSRNSRKKSPKQKMKSLKTQEKEFSGKSAKSRKVSKSTESSQSESIDSSVKSKRFAKRKTDLSKKSKKSVSSGGAGFGKSGVVKKGDKQNESVYFPGVNNPPVQSTRRNGASASRKTKSNQPAYHFPGAGKCTRSMDAVASVDTSAPPPPNNHCVYDVANLGPAQRRVPAPAAARKTPKSMFGAKKTTVEGAPKSEMATAPMSEKPVGNKIVVIGVTPDGKTTVQMTIDMQVIAGEALGPSGKPVDLVPKKILMRGQEIPVETKTPKTNEE